MPVEAWSRIARALGESPATEDRELAQAVKAFITRMPAAIAFMRALPQGWQQQQRTSIERTRQVAERTRPGPEMER
jgi:phage-related protein